MARPSPKPPLARVIELSAWRKRSKTSGTKSLLMPMPVSVIVTTASPPSRLASMMTLPCSVNLMAFESRFQNTCCKRSGSP